MFRFLLYLPGIPFSFLMYIFLSFTTFHIHHHLIQLNVLLSLNLFNSSPLCCPTNFLLLLIHSLAFNLFCPTCLNPYINLLLSKLVVFSTLLQMWDFTCSLFGFQVILTLLVMKFQILWSNPLLQSDFHLIIWFPDLTSVPDKRGGTGGVIAPGP